MSRERSIIPLTPNEQRVLSVIDCDLERLLLLEPSPEFTQRIRTRIAEGNAARTPSWRYGLFAAAALVALVAIGALHMRSQDPPADFPMMTPPQEPHPAARDRAAAGDAAAGDNDAGVRREASSGAGLRVAVSARAAGKLQRIAREIEPEVLVSGEQRLALRRLLDMAGAGTLDEYVFLSAARAAANGESVEPVAPIAVEGLHVAPLIIESGPEGSAGGTGLGQHGTGVGPKLIG
jgi:hypothetical protein